MMWNRVATLHAITTLKELLQDKVDMIPHRSRILPNGLRIAAPPWYKVKGLFGLQSTK